MALHNRQTPAEIPVPETERIREYCVSVEKARAQQESKLAELIEAERSVCRNLTLERQKVEDLQMRLANQRTINGTLLFLLAQTGDKTLTMPNIEHVLRENESQRGIISALHSALRERDDMVHHLQMALQEISQDGGFTESPGFEWEHSSDGNVSADPSDSSTVSTLVEADKES
ncbi:hypothetical protein EYZ11_012481 [Aspergillus tanneri]|uniref:Uncharacterized protein n=1 Tax=Aspergillus tanneri TaxID=1220188 RepID=A0A4V3UMP3_9EURO|nr:hypothetical protein EYZ11_012481 [Aspergillus tanneri]